MTGSNRCTKCGETKPVSEFYRHISHKNGLSNQCKICVRSEQRTYYAGHKKPWLNTDGPDEKTQPTGNRAGHICQRMGLHITKGTRIVFARSIIPGRQVIGSQLRNATG